MTCLILCMTTTDAFAEEWKSMFLIFCTHRRCSLSDSVCEGSRVFMTAQSSVTTVKINIQLPVREAEGSGDTLEPNLCLSIYLPWSKFLSKLELPSLGHHPPTNHGEVSFCPVAQSFQERTLIFLFSTAMQAELGQCQLHLYLQK